MLVQHMLDTFSLKKRKVKRGKEWVYSWNIMDKKTRYLIANNVTQGRSILETKGILKKAILNAETRPHTIVTDGMTAYPSAIKDMYEGTEHIHNAGIRDVVNNNTLERYHGTWRERDKVMRGLKSNGTAGKMLENYRTYYNFIREHSELGKTPSEEAGIDLTDRKNRWIGLIEKSSSLVDATEENYVSNL